MTTPTVIAALIEAANEIERLGGDPSRFHKVAWDARHEPEPVKVRNALERMDALLDPACGLLRVSEHSATVQASRDDMAIIRAAVMSAATVEQPAAMERKPLTLDQIGALEAGAGHGSIHWDTRVSLVRSAERAHGIKEPA